jgi:hypothetical protein
MESEKQGENRLVQAAIVVGALLFLVFVLAKITPKDTTTEFRYGVKIVSEIPLDEIRGLHYLAIYDDTVTAAELTCKFGLSAISKPNPNGYRVRIQEGDFGLYLSAQEATIKGTTESEILHSCYAFACLKDGIDCDEFHRIESFIKNAKSMSVILDDSVEGAGLRGYAEIIGALSYLQTKKTDINRDGVIEQWEVDANEFFIYPFTMEEGLCTAQPFNTAIQNWSSQNETIDCSRISPAIIMKKSDEPQYRVYGNLLVLEGNNDQLHTASIITRDLMAPDWIRRLYGLR